MRRRRSPEVIAGRVSVTGTSISGSGFSSDRSSAGIFTLKFDPGFRCVAMQANIDGTGPSWTANVVSITPSSAEVRTYNGAAAADVQFSFTAVGVQQ